MQRQDPRCSRSSPSGGSEPHVGGGGLGNLHFPFLFPFRQVIDCSRVCWRNKPVYGSESSRFLTCNETRREQAKIWMILDQVLAHY